MPVLPRRDSEVNPGAGEKASENVRIYRSVGLVKRSYEAIIDQTHKWANDSSHASDIRRVTY